MFSLFKDKSENIYCYGKVNNIIYNMDIIFTGKNNNIKLISAAHCHALILTNDNTIWGELVIIIEEN